MLKGLALTPPIIGRIAIGKVVEKNGKRLPEKDDEFTLTSQIQGRDGWINHPLDETLRAGTTGKLRSIPVRLLFDNPELNFRAHYSLFDRMSGRLLCAGNGQTCRRMTESGLQSLPCPSPELCEIGREGHCKPYGRLNVRIGDDDELGSFVFRTTGYNSIRTLAVRLRYFHAVSGGLLSAMPLELRLRGKSTTQSRRAPIYYVDLTVRGGMTLGEAIGQAQAVARERVDCGFDQAGLDEAARACLSEGGFEETGEEMAGVLEEFFPSDPPDEQEAGSAATVNAGSLADKLRRKATAQPGRTFPELSQD
jgi:Recombination directionality factor-like